MADRLKSATNFMKLLTLFCLLFCGCSSLQSYEKTVDSRSIEGYAKDNNGNPEGGVKYTVHYR